MQETAKKNPGPTTTHPSYLFLQSIRWLKVLLAGSAVVATATLPVGETAWAQIAPAPAVAQTPTQQRPPPRQEPDTRPPTQRGPQTIDAPRVRLHPSPPLPCVQRVH